MGTDLWPYYILREDENAGPYRLKMLAEYQPELGKKERPVAVLVSCNGRLNVAAPLNDLGSPDSPFRLADRDEFPEENED